MAYKLKSINKEKKPRKTYIVINGEKFEKYSGYSAKEGDRIAFYDEGTYKLGKLLSTNELTAEHEWVFVEDDSGRKGWIDYNKIEGARRK